MFEKKINKVEKVEGENIFIFQYIDSSGNESKERKSFEAFLQPFIAGKDELIESLKKRLSDKEKIGDLLDEKVIQLSDQIQQLLQEKQQLQNQVQHFLTEIEGKDLTQTTNLYQEAIELFIQGNVSEALSILDEAKLEEIEQKALDSIRQAAETRMLKARILRVDHKYDEAGVNYEKAVKLFTNWSSLMEIAAYFYFLNDFKKGSYYYVESIKQATNDSEKAISLNDYGNLKRSNNELQTAEELYLESVDITRTLAEQDPKQHSVSLALALNNLGILFKNSNDLVQAEEFFNEAVEIYEFLAEKDIQLHLHDIALTMNNLANLQYRRNAFGKAEKTSLEALNIYKHLTNGNSSKFMREKAMLLSNFSGIKIKLNKEDEARLLLEESLEIIQKLAKDNPRAFIPLMAGILNNLANLKEKLEELEDAEKKYASALEIYTELHKNNIQGYYLPHMEGLLNNIALLQEKMQNFDKAAQTYQEALEIGNELVKQSPQSYTPDLARTKLNLAHFHQRSIINKEKSIQLIDEAVIALLPFMEVPYIRNYLSKAFHILKLWNVNVDEYFDEKLKKFYNQ